MNILAILGVTLLLAFLVESLVEYFFGAIAAHVAVIQPYSWLTMYIAAAVGVAGALIYKIDFMHLLGQFLEVDIALTLFGMVITGLAIGRGANYIHDIVVKFFVKPE